MLSVKRTTGADPDFRMLTEELDIDLRKRYGNIQALYNRYNQIADISTVIVAYQGEVPAGCVCFKPYDTVTAEVKRMYVKETFRGNGIASAMLLSLESWAAEKQFTRMLLETGTRQPEAVALYRKKGYQIVENYGVYAGLSYSICMEKLLAVCQT